jgi:transcription termination factor NusB
MKRPNEPKKFGADDSHRFVNGVLDKAKKDLRIPLQ